MPQYTNLSVALMNSTIHTVPASFSGVRGRPGARSVVGTAATVGDFSVELSVAVMVIAKVWSFQVTTAISPR
jgi:hypothetical protein